MSFESCNVCEMVRKRKPNSRCESCSAPPDKISPIDKDRLNRVLENLNNPDSTESKSAMKGLKQKPLSGGDVGIKSIEI